MSAGLVIGRPRAESSGRRGCRDGLLPDPAALRHVWAPAAILVAGFLVNVGSVHVHYSVSVMVVLSVMAMCSREAVLAWLVCSTVVPDPVGGGITNTQGLLVCLSVGMLVLYPYVVRGVHGRVLVLPAAAALVLALPVAVGVAVHADWETGFELVKVLAAAGLLAVVVAHRDFDVRRGALAGVSAGVLGATGYWLHLAGVAQAGHTESLAQSHYWTGVVRIASGKADPNAIGLVLVPLLVAGLAGLVRRGVGGRWTAIGLAAVVVTLPAVVFSCSRGTVAAAAMVLVCVLVVYRRSMSLRRAALVLLLLVGVWLAEAVPGALAEKVAQFRLYAADRGVEGRAEYWSEGFRALVEFPLRGMGYERYLARYRMVPHNTLLDFGLMGGLPAVLVLSVIWALPFVWLWRCRQSDEDATGLLLLCLYAPQVVLSMSLSMPTNKLVWVFWLMIRVYTWRRSRVAHRVASLSESAAEGAWSG